MTGPATVSALIHAATMVKAGVFLTEEWTSILHRAIAVQPSPTILRRNRWIGAFTALLPRAKPQLLENKEKSSLLHSPLRSAT